VSHDGAALDRIKHAARYGRIILSAHARDEMENAGVNARGLQAAILSATTALRQEDQKFRLEGGVATDGDSLVVVVREVQPGLYVITVF
jgi:hypothetical protein